MTENMIIKGGNRLEGHVKIDGAKNAVLPLLAATLLADKGQSHISNASLLSDVYVMNDVLRNLNATVDFDETNNEIIVDATKELTTEAPFELVSKMRASIVVMGPLLSRYGHAKFAMPGGCAIGSRPIDLHVKGFEALGAKVTTTAGYVEAVAEKLIGANIYLDFPSVGATQNIMMAAALAEGTTIIENVAREPEIVDLANFINKMGGHVQGAGTDTIKIRGVESLTGTEHTVIPDRIEAGTFMVAAAITEGDVYIEDAISEHNQPLISKLKELGATITEDVSGVRVQGSAVLKATKARTLPYPGFPTDIQSPYTVAQVLAEGTSEMEETVFENRFMHLEELRRMNANFSINGDTAIITGPAKLQGAAVAASDLRSAAALILAGLRAEGLTKVSELKYLDRGYHSFEKKLQALGANVLRVDVDGKTDAELEALLD